MNKSNTRFESYRAHRKTDKDIFTESNDIYQASKKIAQIRGESTPGSRKRSNKQPAWPRRLFVFVIWLLYLCAFAQPTFAKETKPRMLKSVVANLKTHWRVWLLICIYNAYDIVVVFAHITLRTLLRLFIVFSTQFHSQSKLLLYFNTHSIFWDRDNSRALPRNTNKRE